MTQLQIIHYAHRYGVIKGLAGAAVVQHRFAVGAHPRLRKRRIQIRFLSAVEYRGGNVPAQLSCRHAQMHLKHLSHIHSGRHAQRVKHYLHRSSVRQEGHVLLRQYARNNTLVSVTARHLVAHGDLSLLGNVYAHHLGNARRKLVLVFTGKGLYIHYDSRLAVRHAQRCVTGLTRLFAEYRAQQTLLRRHLGLALGRNLTYQYVSRTHLRTYADNAVFVKILQRILADVGYLLGYLLRSQLRIPCLALILFNMNRGEYIVFDQLLAQQHRVLVVVALPRHERYQHVAPKRYLALIGGRSVRNGLTGNHLLALLYYRALVYAGALVGALELQQVILLLSALFVGNNYLRRIHIGNSTALACKHRNAGILRRLVFYAGCHDRRLRAQQRHCLTLHVRAHQRTGGVIVFQEGDHRRRHRYYLAGGYVNIVHLRGAHLGKRLLSAHALAAHRDPLVYKAVVLIQRLIGLRNYKAVLLIRRKIIHHVHYMVFLVAVLVGYLLHAAVRRFNKAVLVYARIGGKRADKPYVLSFRGLYRAHASVMGVVHVTHLKGRPVTVKTSRSQRGQTALMRQLRKRVVLIHELRKL